MGEQVRLGPYVHSYGRCDALGCRSMRRESPTLPPVRDEGAGSTDWRARRRDGCWRGCRHCSWAAGRPWGSRRGGAVNSPAQPSIGDAVFVSYSHDDLEWRRKFVQMLAPLVRNRGLELWDDTHIAAGDDWRRDIDEGID